MKYHILVFSFVMSMTLVFSAIVTDKTDLYRAVFYGGSTSNIYPRPSSEDFADKSTFGYDIYIYDKDKYYLLFKAYPFWMIAGKYPTDWGELERGVYLSDSLPYVKGITSGYENEKLRVIFGIYTFDAALSPQELIRQKDQTIDSNSDRRPLTIPLSGYGDPFKTLIIHRLEVRPFSGIMIAVNELNLIGGKMVDIVDVNPFGILHNTFGEGFSNTMLGVDFSAVIPYGMSVYGQFAMDDFLVPQTESGSQAYKPTAFAYGAGLRKVFKEHNLYISPKIEFYKIYTWMYNRWQPLLKFTGRFGGIDIPMGFDYGNDMQGMLIGADIFTDEKMKIFLGAEYYQKGSVDLNTSYSDNEKKKLTQFWCDLFPPVTDFFALSLKIDISY